MLHLTNAKANQKVYYENNNISQARKASYEAEAEKKCESKRKSYKAEARRKCEAQK